MKPQRLPALDTLRGALLILMMMEHARQILTGVVFLETRGAPAVTPDAAGIVRMISHIAAPGFFLLMGMGMALKFRATNRLAPFFKRGLLLIALQFTLENLGWAIPLFNTDTAPTLYFGVLFTLGMSMMIATAFMRLSNTIMALLAIVMIVSPIFTNDIKTMWAGVLLNGIYSGSVTAFFPVLPWVSMTLLGVGLERELKHGGSNFFIGLFLLLLYLTQKTPLFYKYPPSFFYLLLVFSMFVAMLQLLTRFPKLNALPLQWLGRHSLVVYLAHIYAFGLLAIFFAPMSVWASLAVGAGVCVAMAGCCAWVEKKRADTFGVLAPGYDAFMRLANLYKVEALQKLLPAHTSRALLDVAGGTGYVASQLAPKFKRVVVFDCSAKMLGKARRRGLETVQGSALEMPFANAEFDVVLCTDALHHIENTERALAEMTRVTQPGGAVVIQEFHIRNFTSRCLACFERLFIERPRYITPDALRDVMQRHGLRVTLHPISRMEYVCVGIKSGDPS